MGGVKQMTTAEAWRERARLLALESADELLLPSGLTVKARRPDPDELAMFGMLPTSLVRDGGAPSVLSEQDAARLGTEMAISMRDLLVWCVLEPRISMMPAAGEIHPRELPREDWQYVIRWAMRSEEVDQLRRFRGQREAGRPGVDGEEVRVPSERTDGDRGPGGSAGAGPGGGAGSGAHGIGGR